MRPGSCIAAITIAIACIFMSACDGCGEPHKEPGKPIASTQPATDTTGNVVELAQGWSEETQAAFYNTPQGSEIMPYAWVLALEQADNNKRFLDPANINRFRYLTRKPTADNPDGLPIGWTRGKDSAGKEWFGLTCAACHTAEFNYKVPASGKVVSIRVDGAPTLADFSQMSQELVKAMQALLKTPDKFERFAKGVLKDKDNDNTRAALRGEVQQITASLHTRNEINKTDIAYGYARIDAIGFILNQTMSTLPNMPENAMPSNAPASYPFLWGTDQSDVVQWTGFAANGPDGAGALVRNGGEVVGVFGRVELSDKDTYPSSLLVENLGKLEDWVRELRAPVWPENILPKIDRTKATQGETLYKQLCASCHQVVPRADQGKAYTAVVTPIQEIGTDPTELNNMLTREYQAGLFTGKKVAVLAGDPIPNPTTGLNPLVNTVVGALLHDGGEALKALLDEHATKTKSSQSNAKGYKARPLNGIWATAPYLHNGSVPNLYEILLPAAKRSSKFTLGSRAFDPKRVGYAMDQPDKAADYTPFVFDTSIKGNLNSGHEYYKFKDGTELSEEQRWQLVEYMKTL